MPELPEVQTTVDGLREKVLGRTFLDVWSDWERTIKKPKDFSEFKKQLKGKKIINVWRRAKNVILELSDGYSLLIHMKMTGHLMVGKWVLKNGVWKPASPGPFEERINGFVHQMFLLDNGQMIALSDVRKFAKIELWQTQEMLTSPEFLRLGPEPLEKQFTAEEFKKVLAGKRGKVKQVIMNQEVLVGVGNIYASEALWLAKIHPEKSVAKLSDKELELLYDAIKKVLRLGIKFGGDSFSDYRDVNGERGKFENKKSVYKREGEPCLRCQEKIKRIVFGARSAFFCPRCQVK